MKKMICTLLASVSMTAISAKESIVCIGDYPMEEMQYTALQLKIDLSEQLSENPIQVIPLKFYGEGVDPIPHSYAIIDWLELYELTEDHYPYDYSISPEQYSQTLETTEGTTNYSIVNSSEGTPLIQFSYSKKMDELKVTPGTVIEGTYMRLIHQYWSVRDNYKDSALLRVANPIQRDDLDVVIGEFKNLMCTKVIEE